MSKKTRSLHFKVVAFVTGGILTLFALMGCYIWYAKVEIYYAQIVELYTFAFGLFILFIGALIWYVGYIFEPMKCLLRFVRELDNDEAKSLPTCHGSVEVDKLRTAIIELLEANRALCSKERDIFKEAAHELKTPVAILRSRLALYKKRDDFKKERFIREAETDIEEIVQHLQELLFLKSVEMDLHGQKININFVTQCDTLQNTFKPLVQKKELKVLPYRNGTFWVYTSEKALQRVLLAVFENIFIHAQSGSEVIVNVDGELRSLEIKNRIAKENDDKLFSSKIGTQIIGRLSNVLGYSYFTYKENDIFVTRLVFEQ